MSNIINIGGTSGGSGSSVVANPQGAATDTLNKLQVDGTIYGVSGGGSSGHNYSTTEQVVGTWIDGKILYEKTVSISPTSLSYGTTIAHGISNVDTIVWLETLMIRSSNRSVILPYASASNAFSGFYADRTNIIFTGGDTWQSTDYSNLYATIRYTKTTT